MFASTARAACVAGPAGVPMARTYFAVRVSGPRKTSNRASSSLTAVRCPGLLAALLVSVTLRCAEHLYSLSTCTQSCLCSSYDKHILHFSLFCCAGRPELMKYLVLAQHKSAKKRVVITGMGVVSSVGQELDTFFDNLCAGKSGIGKIESFDCSDWSTQIAGEIKDFDPGELVSKKMARRLDRSIMFSIVAGKKALIDADLPLNFAEHPDEYDPFRVGILVGSAMGGMRSFALGCSTVETESFRRMNPFCIPFSITNMGGAMLAMDTGCMGPNYSISTACATGNYCMLNGYDHIQRGDADVMLVGATDAAIIPSGIGGFIACKALSKNNEDPEGASRPWDKNRDGFVMGEGSGVMVIEELEHAKRRGAKIYAELLGGAVSCDAHHMTEPKPDGSGVARCITEALRKTGVSAKDVHYVNAHATSTPAGDMAEYRAITTAVPEPTVKINSTKSMIGHLLGGASGVEGVATVMSVHKQRVHPNINLDTPEEDVDLNVLVGNEAVDMPVEVALSNSFGFGGHNSCVVFRRWKE